MNKGENSWRNCLVWFGLVKDINLCGLFNANAVLVKKYLTYGWESSLWVKNITDVEVDMDRIKRMKDRIRETDTGRQE